MKKSIKFRLACTSLLLCAFAPAIFAPDASAQRADNRRLFYTGPVNGVWDNSSASWMTTGSFLAFAASASNASTAVWLTTVPGASTPIVADPAATFIRGDVVVFDSTSDVPPVINPDTGQLVAGNPQYTRTINIASEGVYASDVVVSGLGNFTFTGGAIHADPSFIAPDSVQVTGTGTGYATNYVRPTGSLVKWGTGVLTLSNTAASHFAGGIHLLGGVLSITDNRALGDNNIIGNQISGSPNYGQDRFYGDTLLSQIYLPYTVNGGIQVPAVVTNSSGQLQNATHFGGQTLHIAPSAAGIDITGDIFIGSLVFNFNIEGDTTISGRILANLGAYGAVNGTIVKTGTGTLILSGTQNWFYANAGTTSRVDEGRLVATNQHAIGTGPFTIDPVAVLEFRGAVGTLRQAFVGGGNIEITQRSDITFDWRDGVLADYDIIPALAPANNVIRLISISGTSRFTAIASGTFSSVLGGAGVQILVTDRSTLAVGREGISQRGTGGTQIPMTYAILAGRIDLTGGSTLVLNPNAYLSAGALIVADDSTCAIAFGGSGVSRLRWQDGVNPDSITTTGTSLRYIVPNGMELYINEIPVPVSGSQSIPADTSSSGWCREYILVNQGANPLKDITMTLNALDVLHDTLSSRLADNFLAPASPLAPSRGRKWVNSAWARYMTSQVDYDNVSITTPGITGRISGAVLGFDGILPGRVLAGFYGGASENNLNTTNNTSLSSQQRFIGVNAAQRFGKFYLAGDISTGRVRTDSIRNEEANIVRGKWTTSYYAGSIQAGAIFEPWEKTIVKPFAGLRYTKLKIYDFFEVGPSPLMVEDFNDTGAQVVYGASAGRQFVVLKRNLNIDVSLARKQFIRSPRSTLETNYFDAPDTPVTLKRGDYYSSIIATGISARMALSRNTIAGLAFDYEFSSSHTRFGATGMVAYQW